MSSNPTLVSILNAQQVTGEAAKSLVDSLPALPASSLLGKWHGTCALTNHPGISALNEAKWVGKDFHSFEDVDPIISSPNFEDGREGAGKGRVVSGFMGKARVREVKSNGIVSAAMIYNDKPIIDYFRAIDENAVMGVMDSLGSDPDQRLYFVLERLLVEGGKL